MKANKKTNKPYNPVLWIPLLFTLAIIICYSYYLTPQGVNTNQQVRSNKSSKSTAHTYTATKMKV
jgi:hypothetical protein